MPLFASIIHLATSAINGLMSSTDKSKLDASTNANTASTIVMRDGSGNFSAGTLNLSGLTGTTEVVFNDAGANLDLRVEGDTDTVLFVSDASADKVGVGTNAPLVKLTVKAAAGLPAASGTTQAGALRIARNDGSFNALDIGCSGVSPNGMWLQTGLESNLSITYPLLLNPNAGNVGIGLTAPTARLHIDQSSTTGAVPVLTVDQADVSEEFIRFIGSSANATLTQSIVEAADVGTATLAGYLKIFVQDDGNQLADQAYFFPIYTLA